MGETKKCQWREGTPSDDGPDDPLTGGEPLCDLLQCCFNTLGRVIRFFSGLLDHFQHTRKEFMWLNFHILISIY